ncbi:hypothetical protein PENNAL_c0030G02792 [Penicillium nalgiovense]|uniref:Beta-lactamase-related domain-containing protein n=1 Tax=Penicillium nalgiovense TaxID=60175 RepID=A0A1V6Y902_PENNA|nr:hypothetical protein PENNAL_c0030G02792 [Penicillium nalgiovense]
MVLRSSNSPLTSEFDALIQQQMDKWKVPGLSMAVVHGSSTWSKAYGFAQFPDRKMTTDSLFSTCSTTKAFTAAAMSLAIDDSMNTESPLRWNTPMASILGDDFVLGKDYNTMHATVEDTLSHRSGLSTHDACTAVSHALEQIEDGTLGETLKKGIWGPLGMNDTYFSVIDVSGDPSGYTWDPDTNTYIAEPYMNDVAITGTGAMSLQIGRSLSDLLRFHAISML